MSSGLLVMARKKTTPKASGWTGGPSKPLIFQVRGSTEFKAWAERVAAFDRVALSDLLERAVVRYAREIGFTEEAPSR